MEVNVNDENFYFILGYLANPIRRTLIEAEMHPNRQQSFVNDYSLLTENFSLPARTDRAPYYVWSEDANKWGLELRVYFLASNSLPEQFNDVETIANRPGYETYNHRINSVDIINRLFENGFILADQDYSRINEFVHRRLSEELLILYQDGYAIP